jgi:HK97 family phage prohead protease
MSNKETRVATESFEVRSEDGRNTLVGYGAVFGKRSQDLGGFREVIDPKAFNRTVNNDNDVLVTMNHDVNFLLGRTGAGTARVSVDEIGVRYEVDLPDTTTGADVRALAERGDLFGSSFTFSIPKDGDTWERDEDGTRLRTLTEVRLYELGPVVSPAYLDTSVAVRSLEDVEASEEEEASVADDDVTEEARDEPTLSPSERRRRIIR